MYTCESIFIVGDAIFFLLTALIPNSFLATTFSLMGLSLPAFISYFSPSFSRIVLFHMTMISFLWTLQIRCLHKVPSFQQHLGILDKILFMTFFTDYRYLVPITKITKSKPHPIEPIIKIDSASIPSWHNYATRFMLWLLALDFMIWMLRHVLQTYFEPLYSPRPPVYSLAWLISPVNISLNITTALIFYTSLEALCTFVSYTHYLFGYYYPVEYLFNSPLRAQSLQDFWGYRWNRVVARNLKESIYTPFLKEYKLSSQIAAVLTFAVSGMFHAYPAWVALDRSTKHTLAVFGYFAVQGTLMIAETKIWFAVKNIPQTIRVISYFLLLTILGWLYPAILILYDEIYTKSVFWYNIFGEFSMKET